MYCHSKKNNIRNIHLQLSEDFWQCTIVNLVIGYLSNHRHHLNTQRLLRITSKIAMHPILKILKKGRCIIGVVDRV